jgi:hypothetical protein
MNVAEHQEVIAKSSGKPSIKKVASSGLRGISQGLRSLMEKLKQLAVTVDFIRLAHLDFVPRPDDIFIVTYPRSGTTWVQMILYQLTTDGNMNFTHISQLLPWFEHSSTTEMDLEAFPSPRILKSHLPYRAIPKGAGKYIYVARNGKDVAVSYFHLYGSVFGFKDTFSKFFDLFMRGKVSFGSWFKHVEGWWAHKDDPNVLFLTYEELSQDLEGCIRKISEFCEVKVEPEKFAEIVERCTFTFMKEHESKFDFAREFLLEQGMKQNSFIRKGKVGNWKNYLSSQEETFFEREFDKSMAKLGISFLPQK